MLCTKCQNQIPDGEQQTLNSAVLCEDCYIDAVHPNTPRPRYKFDSAGFMRRLKMNWAVRRQEID